MKWLVDAHLPPSLCKWLKAKGEQAIHVGELDNGLRMPDDAIWTYCETQRHVIITKDTDFADRSVLKGAPPHVVFLAVGNCSNQALFSTLDRFWLHIVNGLSRRNRLIEVRRGQIHVY